MSIPNPLEHINTYGEENLDSVTLRHLADHAKTTLEYNRHLKTQMDGNDEHRRLYEETWGIENIEMSAAFNRITDELMKRKLKQAGIEG